MKLNEKVGLGTVQFGLPYGISNKAGQTDSIEVTKILKTAKTYKIQVLDSASAYGNSEDVLGQNDLSSFKMVSKFMPDSLEDISDQLETSLEKLGIQKLHGYLAHRPLNILENPAQWDKLLEFKSKSKVDKIGFSLNEPMELEQLIDKGYIPDLIQVPYNYFDRRFEPYIKDLKKEGCEIHTRSAFLQGLFFMNPNRLDDFFEEVKLPISQLQKKEFLNGALLKFAVQQPFIDRVIIGVETNKQLVENLTNLELASILPELQYKINENILIPSRWPKN
ncbi:aldo/keto reductase [Christiangramia sp. OXR-203]|jgi:aryl-alcohol dehydrogenase-like predicted oxidoreductase|uniref:aldo/keto reductase n=1 Tax=Christiangramia sp. OXR-203 TaxID=3100176 RepID=UPI002AC8D7BB|nr:aldo/keto reductase [Christiangramia sp. OXR-203]WPY99710.1 aldo/keto reductase [Christiangramia sp. OXR-203]